MFEAETGRLPEVIKSVSDQENTIVQQVHIRKEHLPYDVCPRCGCGIGSAFHDDVEVFWNGPQHCKCG